MKKTLLLVLLLVTTADLRAQSTCETRVDAHQKATTNERVNYCLYPGYEEQTAPGPQLVYSALDSYTIPQAGSGGPRRVTAPDKDFDYEKIKVDRRFVQTRQFPKFTDGRVSEQYKHELGEALSAGPGIAQEAVCLTACEPQADVLPVRLVDETPKGLKARHVKPGRRWGRVQEPAQSTPVESAADTVEEISSTAQAYTYEEGYTPVEEDSGYEPYTPAGIAGEPAGDGSPIDSAAYGTYAPAQTAPQETEIAAGEYSYAPATN